MPTPRLSMAALLAALLVTVPLWHCAGDDPAPPDRSAETPRTLLVISLDTVRPDHLGLYGYDRPTSPTLDALARSAVVFERNLAPTPLTAPAHASLFTGRQPWHRNGQRSGHGVRRNGSRLDESPATLAEVLGDAGWRSAAFVSGFPLTDELSGLGRGFDVYDDDVDELRRPGDDTVAAAVDWLRKVQATGDAQGEDSQDDAAGTFLFVHLYDAHGPYLAPDHLVQQFESDRSGPRAQRIPRYQRQHNDEGHVIGDLAHYVDLYDASLRATDDQVARLLAELDLDRTVVLVVSDHGETLDERAWPLDHGTRLFEEQMHAVGVLAAPGLAPARLDELVSLADFAPTLLDLVGLEGSSLFSSALAGGTVPGAGRSLVPLLAGRRDAWRPSVAYSTPSNPWIAEKEGLELKESRFLAGIVDQERWKLILYPAVGGTLRVLYDLERDPDETENLADLHPEEVARLEALLGGTGGDVFRPGEDAAEVDPESKAALEALGYVLN